MKFKDKKTGDVFRQVNEVCLYFCTEFSGPCYQCPIRGDYGNCHAYVLQHPEEAAKRMGMEVIDATPTGTDLLIEIRNDLTNELTEGANMEHEDKPVTETVDHPAHYNQGGVECTFSFLDSVEEVTLEFDFEGADGDAD